MKTLLLAATLLAASLPGVAANVDVGVSIGISQPGVYGRIDIGRYPQPQVFVQPQVIVQPPLIIGRPIARPVEPVYLWVPVVQQRDWGRHCGRYGACGVPVYFVQDRWYHDHVAPRYRDERREGWRHGERGAPGWGRGGYRDR